MLRGEGQLTKGVVGERGKEEISSKRAAGMTHRTIYIGSVGAKLGGAVVVAWPVALSSGGGIQARCTQTVPARSDASVNNREGPVDLTSRDLQVVLRRCRFDGGAAVATVCLAAGGVGYLLSPVPFLLLCYRYRAMPGERR